MSVTPPQVPPEDPGGRRLMRGCVIALAIVGGVVILIGGACLLLVFGMRP